ncbi:MAG: LacI family transcriptional regulator [Clostridiales bacterium]|jgi:DNA-binding LacI/PurR family transcriptional regulator|nr:LacI family transcriptional regulator [Clostridiales bacterium]
MVRSLLKKKIPFTGIICFNDLIAFEAISELKKNNLKASDQVSS